MRQESPGPVVALGFPEALAKAKWENAVAPHHKSQLYCCLGYPYSPNGDDSLPWFFCAYHSVANTFVSVQIQQSGTRKRLCQVRSHNTWFYRLDPLRVQEAWKGCHWIPPLPLGSFMSFTFVMSRKARNRISMNIDC